ncbi:MAG TPA: fibronectin type III domain-containing protein, partial [Pseudonocardiaceae bacterium]|nr:fibronectin type III domain-containing protein [Pseudonocardiaceae bacterium]
MHNAERSGRSARRLLRRAAAFAAVVLGLSLAQLAPVLASPASAATPLNVFVGYMDTHTVGFSSNQPNPWPYTNPSSYDGTPCPNYPNDTTCWDASAVRLDNPGSTDVTGVQVVVTMGSSTYALWGSNLTVKAGGMLVLTETGSSQNSANFDGSDFPPNAYNGGNQASCANSGAIPAVKITIAGTTTTYLDNGQVLNGGGVDSGHCLNGQFVSGRMDESHPWVQIGAASPVAPSAPQSLAATAGDGSVSLTWQPPASNGGANITGYNIYRGTAAGQEGTTPVGTTNGTTLGFTDTGLANGTTYYYTVKAVNSAGTSAASNEVNATPAAVTATVPTPPQSLTATGGEGSASLSWSAPSSNGGSPITAYDIYRGTTAGGEGSTPVGTTNGTTLTFNDPGLTNGTTYFYTVKAVNAVGLSNASNEASATPKATVPGQPTNLAASAGDTKVVLSWTVPNTDGGSPIQSYNVYRSTTPGGEGSTPYATNVVSSSFTDTGVVNGTTYYYKVAAVNAVGAGQQSGEASATPQPAVTVPGAPTGLTATGGNQSVQLSWAPPSNNGGAAVTGYDVYRSTTPGGEGTTPIATGVTTTNFTDNPLTNGTTYYYTVAAVNSAGISPQSGEASATPGPTAPSAPLSVTASGGNGSVSLAWTVPATNGGSAITGYDVYRSTTKGGEGTTPYATGITTTSFTDSAVTNGTTYYYTVAAVNSAGTSPQSTEASATPQAPTVPGAPTGLTATGGNGSVSLSWTAPASNGGSAITGYDVYRSTTKGGEGTTPYATGITTTSYTDSAVTNGTTYYYTVAAVNSAGTSPQSGEASATPQAASAAGYVGRVGSATASSSKTTTSVPVGASGVRAGDTVVVSLLLSSTSITGAVSATDSAGNSYAVARDTNDGSGGDRTVVLVSTGVKALAAGGSITLTYPSAAETHVSADEFSGVTGVDTSAGATGTAAAFSSGTATTTQPSEILIGVVGIESGKTPTWAAGW